MAGGKVRGSKLPDLSGVPCGDAVVRRHAVARRSAACCTASGRQAQQEFRERKLSFRRRVVNKRRASDLRVLLRQGGEARRGALRRPVRRRTPTAFSAGECSLG
ncbi:hypothetical protein ACP70R_025010 [Stipagrostis hirtigluma subsp. patula]